MMLEAATTDKGRTGGGAPRFAIATILAASLAGCSAPPSTDAAGATANLAAQTTEFYQGFERAALTCDAAGEQVQAAVKRGGDVAAYQALRDAEAACKDAFMAISNLHLPKDAEGETKAALKSAKDACSTAYFSKRDAYRDVATVLDGDTRPSAQATAMQSSRDANDELEVCVSKMITAVRGAGGTTPAFEAGKAG